MYRVFILSSLMLFASSSWAQTADKSDPQQTIQALIQEVNDLKARVAALEAKQSKDSDQSSPPQTSGNTGNKTTEAAPAAQTTPAGNAPEPFGIMRGIRFYGFGAVTFKASDANPPEGGAQLGFRPGSSGNFAVGDVDFYLTSQLTAKTMVLTEVAFSEQSSGEFETDVERLLLKYEANDYLKASFGRFHTSTSYYNQVFHHGFWLQTAVDRPLVVEFSDHGGLLPSQAIGASITGRIPSGKLGLNYVFEYGTANTIRPEITSATAPEITENNGNEITAGLFARPDWLPGLDVGGSYYHDRINPDFDGVPSGIHIAQAVSSVHAVYVTPRFEFLNEAFLVQHTIQETGQMFNTPAFYTLISQKMGKRWRPYFRYQYTNASSDSPLFSDVGLRQGPSAGIRFDANDYVAFKSQYDRTMRRQQSSINDLLLQLAFRF
jgi:hypothetical protein